jgi:hypothetical protein
MAKRVHRAWIVVSLLATLLVGSVMPMLAAVGFIPCGCTASSCHLKHRRAVAGESCAVHRGAHRSHDSPAGHRELAGRESGEHDGHAVAAQEDAARPRSIGHRGHSRTAETADSGGEGASCHGSPGGRGSELAVSPTCSAGSPSVATLPGVPKAARDGHPVVSPFVLVMCGQVPGHSAPLPIYMWPEPQTPPPRPV